ncbi:hypothetical protein CgunFtcFv8_025117 [Champsocephalus gunnari]|uniref:Uncharacterized protein n=1 Tax=Champsocephalus gunnari TaxID=52237 RepID=A0AAN8HM10_CHAGU|nr:hypothetical protein CgunFtcFv8_025117 [Champsocephalus gunnari]
MVEDRRVLEEDSYVDDILTSHNDPKRLEEITEGVEEILSTEGSSLKPWVRSGQSGRQRTAEQVQAGAVAEPGVRLVESKAKLTPLDQKGDVVKAEMCGAVFAARLKTYIVTRGATPEDQGEGSEWQRGPEFLVRQLEEWPMKSAAEVATGARESVGKRQRKAFSVILTRVQSNKTPIHDDTSGKDAEAEESLVKVGGSPETSEREEASVLTERRPEGKFRSIAVLNLVKLERFSSLARLCGVVARRGRAAGQAKWEARVLDNRKVKPVPLRRNLASGLLKIPKWRTKKKEPLQTPPPEQGYLGWWPPWVIRPGGQVGGVL